MDVNETKTRHFNPTELNPIVLQRYRGPNGDRTINCARRSIKYEETDRRERRAISKMTNIRKNDETNFRVV